MAGNKPMCHHPKDCFNMWCDKDHTEDKCSDPNSCQDFHCPKRHSKQRTRCCFKGAGCQKVDCNFMHPQNRAVLVPARSSQATAPRQSPQGAAARQGPQAAAPRQGPQAAAPRQGLHAAAPRQDYQAALPVLQQSPTVVQVTGFGSHVSDLNMAGEKLQDALKQLSGQQVIVEIPNRASVLSINAEAFAYFPAESCGAARLGAEWINSAAAKDLELGALKAVLVPPNAAAGASANAQRHARAVPSGAPAGSMHTGQPPRNPTHRAHQPAQSRGPASVPQESTSTIPGVTELRAFHNPALATMWKDIERVLKQHQDKVVETKQELERLADEPAYLRASDLKKAKEAIERLLKELEDQRLVFLEYVGRCVQANMSPEVTLAALARELYRLEGALPALAVRRQFEAAIQAGQFVVVKGETGSGKSTQLPQYLADMRCLQQRQIIVTQPRKVAAQELAKRVGLEYAAGDRRRAQRSQAVGFHVGGNRSFNPQLCRIKYMTEAVLLNEMLNNADLSRYGAIIVDEAHERSINTDVLLGLLKRDIKKYPALKICVTSATIETKMFCNFFGQAGSLEIPGRMFPVAVRYMPIQDAQNLARPVVSAVLKILDETTAERQTDGPAEQSRGGDVLVFLTGQEDVDKAQKFLEQQLRNRKELSHLKDHVHPMALYSQQKPDRIQAAVAKGVPGIRRVVFTTNVAETSLTIDGVTVVVDAGFTKESLYDHQKRMKILQTFKITRSSAKQRKGRAGRTSPGICYRLYSEQDMMAMQPSQTAEILRSPLELTILNLKQLGIDAQHFDWLEAPDRQLLDTAVQQLRYLEALEPAGEGFQLTPFGRLVISLQMDPQICRVIHYGLQRGMGMTAVTLAALLTSGMRMFFHRRTMDSQAQDQINRRRAELMDPQGSDIVTALKVYSKWMEVGSHTPSNSRPGSAGGASQADDNASEASSEYSTGSVYGGHFSQQGAAAANRWCDEYSVNGKTLGMARAARADIIKQLASANIALVSDHEAECGPDDINQMFAAGFFQNLASKRGSANSFLAAESQQVGAIHPSSAYNELHPNTWSHWLSFMELFRSSQVFLMQVAPFNIEWLAQLAPLYHQERGDTLKETAMERRVLSNLSRAMIGALVGKQQCNLIALERSLQASIAVDYRLETLTIWALPRDIELAVKQIEDMCETHRANLLRETHEVHKQGSTRVVYGAGCEVRRLLLGNEFVRLNVEYLPRSYTDDMLKLKILELVPAAEGQIDSATVEGHPQSSHKWAHIQFAQPEHAAAAQGLLHNYILEGRSLVAKPAGLHNSNQSNMMNAKLMVLWNTGVSTGTAYVKFATAESANDAITFSGDHPLNGQVLAVKAAPRFERREPRAGSTAQREPQLELELDAEGRYTGQLVGAVQGKAPVIQYQVKVTELPPQVDEIMLQGHFQFFGNVAGVNVVRKDAAFQEDEDDALRASLLMSRVPESFEFPVQSQISIPNTKHRSGLVVHYENVAQTKAAAAFFRNQAAADPAAYSYMEQPVRAVPDFTYTVSFHRAIFDSRKAEYEAVQTWSTSHGVRCIVKDIPGIQPRKLFRLTCSDEAYLLDARRQLDRLLHCSVIKRDELLSHYGRTKMQDVERAACDQGHTSVYLHWDNSTRQIRVYGSHADQEHLIQQLNAAADELAALQKVVVEIPPRRKRQCHQELPRLNNLPGVVSVQILGGVIEARCTDAAAATLRQRVSQLTGRNGNGAANLAGATCCVCADVPDERDESFTLQACGCKACTQCIKPMFMAAANSATVFPLTCPGDGCGKAIIMRDIVSLTDPDDLEKIMKKSFSNYKLSTADIFECMAMECQQVGRLGTEEDMQQWQCDVCLATYCVPCQKVFNEAVPRHRGMSCQEYRDAVQLARTSAGFDLTSLQDVCPCPECNIPISKGVGCLHMHCPFCDMHFCWGCGQAFGKGGQHTTYSHAGACTGPRVGDAN